MMYRRIIHFGRQLLYALDHAYFALMFIKFETIAMNLTPLSPCPCQLSDVEKQRALLDVAAKELKQKYSDEQEDNIKLEKEVL